MSSNITDCKPSSHPPIPENWASLADRLNPARPTFDAALKASWKTMSKAERKRIIEQDRRDIRALKQRGSIKDLPFTAETDDHCETSPVAYRHIAPFLEWVAGRVGKKSSDLMIYDPYYCAGAVVGHLKRLGFDSVYNRPEDFYQVIREGNIPRHDVINQKPTFLLLPEHFSTKSTLYSEENFCFLAPLERYHYWTPEGMRMDQQKNENKKKQHMNLVLGRRNSPFVSYWFISMEPFVSKETLVSIINRGDIKLVEGCRLHRHQSDIKPTNFKGKEVTPAAAACSEGDDNVTVTKTKRPKKRRVA
ncbi:hypothetical protein HJC23_004457 [Cyclotella cryptica]|uniref:HMG box domain-containing protein n=1 Tax=Cyclotella cryptica TaxID=29204 RepID=A0ABD3QFZ2_9STRA